MRFLFILTITTMLFLANVGWADSYDDCKVSCAADKGTRDMNCPSPYDSSDASQKRDQCLQSNLDAYIECTRKCPPTPPPPPEEPASPLMRY